MSQVWIKRLQKLCISGCPNLVKVSFESIPSLRVVGIEECGYGVLRSLVCEDSAITRLGIGEISGLTDASWKGVMMHLGAVEELEVSRCNEIRYLWESEAEASKVLVNLRDLRVSRCSKLVSFGEKEEEEGGSNLLLTSLRVYYCESMTHCICGNSMESLEIEGCSSMTYVICGNSMESLEIERCRSLTSVSFPTAATEEDGKQNLKSLVIWNCEKLLMIEELGGKQNILSRWMAMLQSVTISNWENLKSLNELSYSIHLTSLFIEDCKSLESLPDREFQNLKSLTEMGIGKCPSMDACFPRGNWPPNLCSLGIGGLKKPISEWGNQNFPTSLVQLRLLQDDDDISQLSEDLLPKSLTFLAIIGFEKLETISTVLQHLTSLKHLSIVKCPKIKDLPETLLPSLLSLEIIECPKLKERSNGRDSHYWPLIYHIPDISIHDDTD